MSAFRIGAYSNPSCSDCNQTPTDTLQKAAEEGSSVWAPATSISGWKGLLTSSFDLG